MAEVFVDASQLTRFIRSLELRAKNLKLAPIGEIARTAVDDVFQAEGAVGRNPKWDPLTQATIDRNPRRAGGMILQATGLMANIQTNVQPQRVTIASPAKYARHHVNGTRWMPKRDFFAVDERKMFREIETNVLEQLAGRI